MKTQKKDLTTTAYEKGIQDYLKEVAESGSDVHENYTPAEICDMMLDKVDLTKAETVLVLYNIELLFALKKRKFSGHVTFFTQSQEKADLAPKIFSNLTVEYIDKEENPLYHMENKWPDKFDIVVANPPYSGKDIKFLDRACNLSKKEVLFVHPASIYINKKDLVLSRKNDELLKKLRNFVEYISIFNGNKAFGIAAKYPISIIHLNMSLDSPKIKFKFEDKFKGQIYEIQDFEQISVFGFDEGFNKFRELVSKILLQTNSIFSISNYGKNFNEELEFYVETGFMAGHEIRNEDAECFYKKDFFVIVNKPRLVIGRGECQKNSIVWRFETESEAKNFLEYVSSDFARACLATVKFNQNLHRGEIKAIPLIDFKKNFDEEKIMKDFLVTSQMRESIKRNILNYYD
jgi:hypothetical protein